jgi:predicted transcriptional regulator
MTEEELVLMVESTRKEDEGNTLWKVFNRVQEHLTHGGFVVKNKAGKQRKVRKITNMLADVELNQNLWEMATQFTDYELVA